MNRPTHQIADVGPLAEPNHRFALAGARGGQGTTTLATVVALTLASRRRVRLDSAQPDDVCALLGSRTPPSWHPPALVCPRVTLCALVAPDPDRAEDGLGQPSGMADVVIVDHGRLDALPAKALVDTKDDVETRWLVVRGPCYLSLRRAIGHPWCPDGVILVIEPGRALTATDVSDVLGVPVVAEIPVDPTVARVIDAGLLLDRVDRLGALRSLRRLVMSGGGPDGPGADLGANSALAAGASANPG